MSFVIYYGKASFSDLSGSLNEEAPLSEEAKGQSGTPWLMPMLLSERLTSASE